MRVSTLLAATTGILLATAVGAKAQQNFFGLDTDGDVDAGVPASLINASAQESLFLEALTGGSATYGFSSESLSAHLVPLDFEAFGLAILSTPADGFVSVVEAPDPFPNGRGGYPISFPYYMDAVNTDSFRIEFGSPVAGFGFYGIDIGDGGGELWLDFISGSNTETIQVAHATGSDADASAFFFGRVDGANPFDAVEFRLEGVFGDVFTFDDMTVGSVTADAPPVVTVPEPTAILLVGTGLMGIGVVATRRRRNAVEGTPDRRT